MYIRRVAALVAAILLAGLVNAGAAQLEESRVLQRSGALGAVAPRAAPKDEPTPTTSSSKSSSTTSSPTKLTEKPSPQPPSSRVSSASSSSSSSSSISTSFSSTSTSSSASRDTVAPVPSSSPRGDDNFGPVPTPIPKTTISSTHSTTKNTTTKTTSSSKPFGTSKPGTSSSHTTSKVTGLSDEPSKTTSSRTSKPSAPRISGDSSQSSVSVSSATGSVSGTRERESGQGFQPTSSTAAPIVSDVTQQVPEQGNNDGQVVVNSTSGMLHNKQATILVFTFAAVIAIGLASLLGWCCWRRHSRQDKHVMLDEKNDSAAFGRSNSTGSRSSRRARPVSISSDSSVGGWHYTPARFAGVAPMRQAQATLADRLAEDPFSVHRVVYPDMPPPPEGGAARRTYALFPDPPTPVAAAATAVTRRPSSRSPAPAALDVATALRESTASGRPYSPESQYDEESVYAGVQRRPYMIERRPERRSSAQAM